MRAELQVSDVPKVAFYRDPRIRAIFYQLLVVGLVFLGGYILVSNTMANLAKLGVAGGFAFLDRSSGFDIGQSMIDYSSSDTFGRAFIVGFLNTILVAVVGIFFATIIGFTMGIARLSHNWLVSTLASIYIEIVRNIPLLLQLLLVYAVIIHALPQPRESGVAARLGAAQHRWAVPAAAGAAAGLRRGGDHLAAGLAGDPASCCAGPPASAS